MDASSGQVDETDEVSLDQLEEEEEREIAGEEDEEAELEELVEEPDVDTDEHEVDLDELLARQFTTRIDDEVWADELEPATDVAAPVDLDPVAPASASEFVCRSCFLIRHRRQMADSMLCRDCAANS